MAGLAINLIVLLRLGPEGLGVFNQIYAIYVIAGQIAVFGLNDSAQKHVAEFIDNRHIQHSLGVAALLMVIIIGFFGASLLASLSGVIRQVTKSPDVGLGVLYLSPGLFFFTINKVLIWILNGQRRMVAFAVGSAMRVFGILAGCLFITMHKRGAHEFGLAFSCAEIFLFIFLLFFIRPLDFKVVRLADVRRWMPRHALFGGKALVNGFLAETFLRIDIILLGIFCGDREVGIYSFASIFVEGIYQVPVVIRNIVNPMLVKMLILNGRNAIILFARKIAAVSFLATLSVSALIALIYPHFSLFLPGEVINASYGIILVLLSGLAVYSTCIPFDYIFLQAGKPGIQSIYMTINTAINVILNSLLIPLWGIYGSCVATAVTFILAGVSLNIISSKTLGFHKGIFIREA